MKCEPLKNKKHILKKDILKSANSVIDNESDFYLGFKKGVDDSFNEFASYVDLFMRYKNNVRLLMNEQKDVWLKFVKYFETQRAPKTSNYLGKYNNWLFDYIFRDVNCTNPDDLLSL